MVKLGPEEGTRVRVFHPEERSSLKEETGQSG